MAKLIDSSGKGAAITGAEYDSNVSTLAGKNQSITATTHTIAVSDQGEVIEYSNASAIAVTLPAISAVSGSNIHTDDFTVTLKNIGAGVVTITRAGTDTFEDSSTSKSLAQYEFITIQTDNSLTKWNILQNYIDVATKSGTETLTNKTIEYTSSNTGSVSRTVSAKLDNYTNILDFGATGDGATDDTVAIQAAIDYMYSVGGGEIFFPRGEYICVGIVPKNHVFLVGEIFGMTSILLGDEMLATKLTASGAGDIISQTSGTLTNFGMSGFLLKGLGSATACKGISLSNVHRGNFKYLSFDNFSDNAIKVLNGVVCSFGDLFAQNCLLNTTRSQKDGVIDIDGTDHYIGKMEITASLLGAGGKSSANLYVCALAIRGTNHFVANQQAEISDIGMYLTCDDSRFSDIRADLNQGHGWELVGASGNQFSNCNGYRNSVDTTNTYDQWSVDSASVNNHFINCIGQALSVDSWKARYGFNDAVVGDTNKNYYVNCRGLLSATSDWNIASSSGSAVSFTTGASKTWTAADATPSVSQYCFFRTGAADTYTNFDDGVSGQSIKIRAGHSATLTNNATIKTNTGANKQMAVNRVYKFTNDNGVWYEDGS